MIWDDFLKYEIFGFGDFKLIVGNVILAIIVIVITWFFIYGLKRAITRPRFITHRIDVKRRTSIYLILKYFIWTISLVIVLEVIGIDVGIVLVGSTALLVGLGLGLQNIFKDLVSGLFLLFEGTIQIGDILEVDGVVGRVMEINLRNSQVMTRDDVMIIIPNSKFVSEKVINWSTDDEKVRFQISVGVSYGSDIDLVFECLENVMKEDTRIVSNPKPFARFVDFGESSLDFQMIFWSRETFRIENLKSDLRRKVYKELAKNNLKIPFPQRDIHIIKEGEPIEGRGLER